MFAFLTSPLFQNLILTAAVGLGGWIATRIKKPSDKDRAEHLSLIAAEAAALVVSLYPNASWSDLLARVVAQIADAAGVPTGNSQAIQRAATAALSAVMAKQ